MAATLEEPKIDVHQAVKTAIGFFQKSFAREKTQHLQLEEVELSEDGRIWLITLGYDDPVAVWSEALKPSPLLRPRPLRKYKVVRIDAQTGKPMSVKIR
ncbi:MAG TPA: hypothetical protein VI136_19000 [Verrucomicrobiae bacterium]